MNVSTPVLPPVRDPRVRNASVHFSAPAVCRTHVRTHVRTHARMGAASLELLISRFWINYSPAAAGGGTACPEDLPAVDIREGTGRGRGVEGRVTRQGDTERRRSR